MLTLFNFEGIFSYFIINVFSNFFLPQYVFGTFSSGMSVFYMIRTAQVTCLWKNSHALHSVLILRKPSFPCTNPSWRKGPDRLCSGIVQGQAMLTCSSLFVGSAHALTGLSTCMEHMVEASTHRTYCAAWNARCQGSLGQCTSLGNLKPWLILATLYQWSF